mgnify:FL=1
MASQEKENPNFQDVMLEGPKTDDDHNPFGDELEIKELPHQETKVVSEEPMGLKKHQNPFEDDTDFDLAWGKGISPQTSDSPTQTHSTNKPFATTQKYTEGASLKTTKNIPDQTLPPTGKS